MNNALGALKAVVTESGWASWLPMQGREDVMVVAMALGKGSYVTFEVVALPTGYEISTPFTRPETREQIHSKTRFFETEAGAVDCLKLVLCAWKPDKLPVAEPVAVV